MTPSEIHNGESATLEFKESLPEQSLKYTKTAVAFANGCGGRIVFGIKNDSCEIVGIPREKLFTDMDAITNAICDSCEPKIVPAISFQEIDDKSLIVVEIEAGMQRPYYIKSQGIQQGTYFRAGATTRQVEPYMLQELILEGSGRSLDSIVYKNETVTDEVVGALCHSMTEYAISHCLNDMERAKIRPLNKNQLCMWGLLVEQKGVLSPTLGFKLLAGQSMPEVLAEIQCGVFKGHDRAIFINRQEYDGALFKQVDEAYDFVLRMIRVGAKIDGVQRQDVYEFPLGTIRELLVNAVCHRSYLRPARIQVALYDDRLEITSPGMLSRDLTVERLKEGYSIPRNKAIAKAFAYMNLVEGWGSGIPRIIRECREYGLQEPEFIDADGFLRINLYRKNPISSAIPSVNVLDPSVNPPANPSANPSTNVESLPENLQQVLDLISANHKITYEQLAEKTGKNRDTIRVYIKRLRTEYHLLDRVGAAKNGHWVILQTEGK